MTGITRLGDTASNEHDDGEFANDTASDNVIVNGLGAHRVGDHWTQHQFGPGSHDTVSKTGSSTVFVNDKAVVRIGDTTQCNSIVITGSNNVEVGK